MQNHNLPLTVQGDYIYGNTAALTADEDQQTVWFMQAFRFTQRQLKYLRIASNQVQQHHCLYMKTLSLF